MSERTGRFKGRRQLKRLSHHSAGRRGLLKAGLSGSLLGMTSFNAHAATIVAIRVWPAQAYTRITLELDRPVKFNHILLQSPARLVVTLEGLQVDSDIRDLIAKVKPDDPYIRNVSISEDIPGAVQLIFALRKAVAPDLFSLQPIARYSHRLVIDMHPASPQEPLVAMLNQQHNLPDKTLLNSVTDLDSADPLAALIRRTQQRPSQTISNAPLTTRPATTSPETRHKVAQRPAKPRRAPIRRLVTIAIDAGHGGEDPGASGQAGTHEKDIVLPIAAELRQLIRDEPGMRAYMTREGDYFVPLRQRVDKAEQVAADLFISIHADAAERTEAQGSSVYVLSPKGATSTAASWLATQENRSDRVGGVRRNAGFDSQARRLLMELSAHKKSKDSQALAGQVLNELSRISPIHKSSVERAEFVVLKTPDIPAILVETAFLSNPDDEKRLRSAHHRRQIARAIFEGLRKFVNGVPLDRLA